jgi:AbiV family abortive infection protein
VKSSRIGLKQADRLTSMPTDDRRAFIAEGLTIIQTSAVSFWGGARLLCSRTREADVLEAYAAEEAAKILILLDVFRAPAAQQNDVLRQQLKRFYSHHDRLLYAEAVKWKPMHRAQLQEYLDHTRRSHILDGPAGEFILPNGPVFERERKLYADVITYEDEAIHWNDPVGPNTAMASLPFFDHPPAIVSLIVSMSRIGLFTVEGLRAIEVSYSPSLGQFSG